ncbi:hypothetical protein MMC26_005123 [Xylographa opegraphella]|nr:hypothetical protein [Xylographa opegraphella]
MEDSVLAKEAKISASMFLDNPKDPLEEEAIEAAKKMPPDPNPVKFRHLNVDADTHQYDLPTECASRPGFNTSGQGVLVNINSYAVVKFPDKVIYQYDVLIGSGVEKRGLVTKVWNSKAVQKAIGNGWVFDGNRLAWSMDAIPNRQFTVDLDEEQCTPSRPGRLNSHKVQIRPSTKINLASIQAYLDRKMSMDNSVLQAIDFLDHLMRVTPSKNMYSLKRSFFDPKMVKRERLGGGVEAMKGVYQSIRIAHGSRLVVNVDVSNCVFYGDYPMEMMATQVTGSANALICGEMSKKVKPTFREAEKESLTFLKLKKLKKIRFRVRYRGASEKVLKQVHMVKEFSQENCYNWFFNQKDKETGVEKRTSIFDYFMEKYNIHLSHPTMCVVETMKRGIAFPMEVCYVEPGQKYPYKIDAVQTASMIKFAVTRPKERREGIEGGLALLNWENDPYIKNYGLKISKDMLETQARLLAPPIVQFAKTQQKPGLSGRWRLDGQQFLLPNKNDLIHWGVCIINSVGRDRLDKAAASTFIRTFVNTYKGHGGKVSNANPPIMEGPVDEAKCVTDLFNEIVAKTGGGKPQMMVFLLAGKDSLCYERIKRSCDCRYGVVSQCMQNAHVKRGQGQYISNVLMKFNAKLGGTTSKVAGKPPGGHFKIPTMIVGADVSHASPGSLQPSMAALTCSMDKTCCRYAAACESNGHRVEMVTQFNLEDMLTPLFRQWMSEVGMGRMPQQFFYFRDGVSEGQYQHVIQQEVKHIKRIWRTLDESNKYVNYEKIKFTVIVASKRHHIRFFPKERSPAADKNLNPCPGVLVEKDVTHPFEYDFYLNSHSAIQGTARPTHYHVLMDESKFPPNELQNMIYEHCYQYMRSTTPVSLFPAVYYAHLASKRAVSHENRPASSGAHQFNEEQQRLELIKLKEEADREGKKLSKTNSEKLNRFTEAESRPLIKMKNDTGIMWGMWYI